MPKKPTKNPDRALALIAIVEPRLDELGLSAAAFGRKAGIGVDAVSNLKKGTIPGAAKLVKMADALDLPLSRILAAAVPYAAIARGNSATTRRLTDGNVTHLTQRIDTTTRLKLAFPDRFISLYRQEVFPSMTTPSRDVQVSMAPAPGALADRDEGYGVYVGDSLNAPALLAGHIAFIDPQRPVVAHGWVRVFPSKGAAFLALLESGEVGMPIRARVLTESNVRRFAAGEVTRLERVVGFQTIDA